MDDSPRVFLALSLEKVPAIALADSGADISVLSRRMVQSLGDLSVDRDRIVSIRGHGRSAVSRSLGVVCVSVDVGGLVAPNAEFHVVEDVDTNHDVILGADFMHRHYLAPSPAHGRLIYAPPDADIEFVGNPAQFARPLYLKENIHLKPARVNFITVKGLSDLGQETLFEPNPEILRHSVAMCRSLETVQDQEYISLEALCYSPHKITLRKGTLLGYVHQTEYHRNQQEIAELTVAEMD